MNTDEYEVIGLLGIAEIQFGDDLSEIIVKAIRSSRFGSLAQNDVVVVASKVVSICEGRRVDLSRVIPTEAALDLSQQTGKDARVVELILKELTKIRLASPKGPIIANHKIGYELTSAGIDNAGDGGAYLLPTDPDRSARGLANKLELAFGVRPIGVIVADSDGRADRDGAIVIAIGSAGFAPLRTSEVNVGGRVKRQEETIVDMLAGAAAIVIGQRGRGVPVAIIRGVQQEPSNLGLRSILHRGPS